MNIIIGNTAQITKDPGSPARKIKRLESYHLKDRRRNKTDRRKSHREGVFVSISTHDDRRGTLDRRNG